MANSRKKKSFRLIILMIAMFLVIGGYAMLAKHNATEEVEESAKETTESVEEVIAVTDSESVEQMTYKNKDGGMTLVLEDDAWKKEDDKECPINQDYASGMLSALAEISVMQKVTDSSDDLAEFGLDNPSLTASITTADKTVGLTFGSQVVTEDGGYYGQLDGSEAIYIFNTTIYDTFSYTNTQMIALEEPPVITTDTLTKLSVEQKDGVNFEAISVANEKSSSEYDTWNITKPYEKAIVGDTTALTTLFENYTTLTFDECVDYHASDLSKYGLEEPNVTILMQYYKADTETADTETTDTETTDKEEPKEILTYKLLVGKMNEDGSYYVKSQDSTAVNLMSAELVETMLGVNAFDYVLKSVFTADISTITSIDITEGKTTHIMRVDDASSDDSESTEKTYYYDDAVMDETTFVETYQGMLELAVEAEIKDTVTDNNPYMTITLHRNTEDNTEITVNFLPYDDNYYRVDTGETEYFLINKRTIDDLVK